MANVIVLHGSIEGKNLQSGTKIKQLKSLHQFDFNDQGAIVKKFSGIGKGKQMKFDTKDIITAVYQFEIVNLHQLDEQTLCPLRTTILPWKDTGKVVTETNNLVLEDQEDQEYEQQATLGTNFTCPMYPCQAKFLTFKGSKSMS